MTTRRGRKRSPTLAPVLKPSLLVYLWLLTHTLTATTRTVYTQTVQAGLGSWSSSSSSSSSSDKNLNLSNAFVNLNVIPVGVGVSIPAAEAKKNIPSSKSPSFLGQFFSYTPSSSYDEDLPPWNPSPQIDHNGFLSNTYKCVPGSWEKEAQIGGKYGHTSKHTQKLAAEEQEVYIRQVPGDGNCLFHSLAAALSWVQEGVHLDFDENSRPPPSLNLRNAANSNASSGRESGNGNGRGGGGGFLGRGFSGVGPNPGGSRDDDDDGGDWMHRLDQRGRRRDRNGGQRHPNSRHLNLDESMDIYTRSAILRQKSVDMLQPSPPLRPKQERQHHHRSRSSSSSPPYPSGGARKNNKNFQRNDDKSASTTTHKQQSREDQALFLQGSEKLQPKELLQVACSQYGMSGEEYCKQMKNDGVWGGGPEIVSLSNYLKRPIHVYELISVRPRLQPKKVKKQPPPPNPYGRGKWAREQAAAVEKEKQKRNNDFHSQFHDMDTTRTSSRNVEPEFRLRRMACFGSPRFDDREPLHILSADCRFPDLEPGLQATAGNHFMAVFPEPRSRRQRAGAGTRHRHKSPVISLQSNVRVRSGGSDSSVMKGVRRFCARTSSSPKTSKSTSTRNDDLSNNKDRNVLTRMMNFCSKCSEWRDETAVAAAASTTEMLSKNYECQPLRTFKRWFQC